MVRSMRAVFVTRKNTGTLAGQPLSCQEHPHTGAQQDSGMHGAGQRQHKQESCSLMPVHA